MLSFSKCLVCVFCLFTPFLSVLFVFYRKNLVLLHLMNRLHFLQVNNFLKGKTLWKIIFWYQWIIQCNTDSCREHMTGGVNKHLYGCVSARVCCVSLRVWVWNTASEIAHQMWHDHPFIQRNKTSKIALDKILKRWVVNIGGSS